MGAKCTGIKIDLTMLQTKHKQQVNILYNCLLNYPFLDYEQQIFAQFSGQHKLIQRHGGFPRPSFLSCSASTSAIHHWFIVLERQVMACLTSGKSQSFPIYCQY